MNGKEQAAITAGIISGLVAKLRARDDAQLTRELEELIEQNYAVGMPKQGFLFGGEFHTVLPVKSVKAEEKKLIHASLKKEAAAYCDRKVLLNKEMTRIANGLSLVLRPCTSWQDIRDALPDPLRNEIDETKNLRRLKAEAWPLQDSPLQLHQYQQTAELLLFYYTNRLIY